jgi:hypothetical protein
MLLGRDLALDVVDGELRPQVAADLCLRRFVRLERITEPYLRPTSYLACYGEP